MKLPSDDDTVDEGAIRCALGVETRPDGSARVALSIGSIQLSLSPEEAEQLGGDLYRFALEVRDGGAAQDRIGGWPVSRSERTTEPELPDDGEHS